MPPLYIGLHLAAATLCLLAVRRSAGRPPLRNALGVAALAVVLLGFLTERSPDLVLRALPALAPHLVYLVNVALEGAAVLAALVWLGAPAGSSRVRPAALAVAVVSLALWSYAWYFQPLPPDLNGQVDATGLCRQTTDDSCTAAAAATLLHHYGIIAGEREMAGLCLTRDRTGTSRLGLFRGLAVRAGKHGLRPHIVEPGRPERLFALGQPALLTIGLKPGLPRDVAARLERCGWSVGSWHTVVLLGSDEHGQWLDIADPSYGREHWPIADLAYIWDGSAVVLARP
ncbi:MAG: hypothetical protein HYU66_18935 [Armatimonadetes bacterium]|nr:hypothetical protein [Armatimonadota bacterium]